MAITEKRNELILTGEDAKSFKEMADNPNPETIRKRNAFIKEIKETLQVREENGVTYIKL